MTTKPSTKADFHFVTGVPLSESEKRNVRTIVRSNASNRRWKLVRETAAKAKTEGRVGLDGAVLNVKATFVEPKVQELVEINVADRDAKKQRLAEKNVRRQYRAQSNPDLPPCENPVKITNIAQYYYGIMPATDVSKQSINRMLQGTALSYASLFPAGKGKKVSQMAKDWFQQCLKTSGILHTALFCQAMRVQAMRPGQTALPGNELVLCQTEAVHAINDKFLRNATATDDESIRIVFSLAWHGTVKQDPKARFPKQVPLANLQSLGLFMGFINYDPIHIQGLDHMLSLRGGLNTVQMPGLAFLVSVGDVLMASHELRRPKWSYGSYANHDPDAHVDDEWLRMTHRTDHPLATLGDGFAALHRWLPYERASPLQLVFANMADYIRASDDFIRSRPDKRNCAVMVDQRNAVQHRLMTLCLIDEDQFLERELYELCWLAGFGYSLIAVFPLAPNAARFDRLAGLIKSKLVSTIVLQRGSQAPELVLWISVVGALCAIGTSDRDWYVEVLRQEIQNLRVSSWYALRTCLMEFLWFPTASDEDGMQLWTGIQQVGRILEWSSTENG